MPSKGDLKFGHVAIDLGHCEKAQIEECLKIQAALEKQGKVTSIDRVLMKKGYITPGQISEIEKKQGRRIIFCAKCSAKLNVAIFGAGTKIRCPKCDASLVVPAGTKYEVVEKGGGEEEEEEERKKGGTIRVKREPAKAAPPAKPARPAKPLKKHEPEEELLDEEPEEESVDEVEEVGAPPSQTQEADELLEEEGEEEQKEEEVSDELEEEAPDKGGADDALGGDSDIEILDDVEETEEKPARPAASKARQNDPTEKMPELGKAKVPPSTSKPGQPATKSGAKAPSRLDRFKKK